MESEYGSAITIEERAVDAFIGIYHPTPTKDAATLEGRVVRQSDGTKTITGSWRHTHGPKSSGIFELRTNASDSRTSGAGSQASGWWAASGEEGSHLWTWDGLNALGERSAVRRSPRLLLAWYSEATAYLFLLQTIASLVLLIATMRGGCDARAGAIANFGFNVVYSICYFSFLLM